MSDAKRFIEIIEQWRHQPDFQALTRYNQYRHWLDYQRLHEHNFRNMLAWLLNPREGHGLGDLFIRALLNGLKTSSEGNAQSLERWAAEDSWLPESRLAGMDLGHACVAIEVGDKAGRIDLVLVDPHNRLVIAIERKDGHHLTEGQLARYSDWIESRYGQHYHWLGIVSDSHGRAHRYNDSNWLQINDEWLITALNQALARPGLDALIRPQLDDIRSRLIVAAWEQDPYFAGINEQLRDFAQRHAALLGELHRLKCFAGPYLEIDQAYGVRHVLPNLLRNAAEPSEISAVQYAMEQNELLNALWRLAQQ